jgi:hypothetical protein
MNDMKIYQTIITILGLAFVVSCTNSPEKDMKSVVTHREKSKHVAPKKSKKELIMDEYHEMKRDLEPNGYIITTDSTNYIYIDNSVKVKFTE